VFSQIKGDYKMYKNYPYFFEWAIGQSSAHTPTAERVIELSTDRPEYELQFAALVALAED